jgi:cellulose synthase/poly-beta-1,6-N-acetylglucosamine synthase-like glycosyltransferase
MKIRHLDIVVETDAPATWRGLFLQRRLWWAGSFRHWWVNFDRNAVHLPLMTIYSLTAIWASLYSKWWTLIDWHSLTQTLPLVIAAYVMTTVISNLQVASPWMLVLPVYSILQVVLMPPIGALCYVTLARRRGYLGRYRFGYRRRRPPQETQPNDPKRALRVAHTVGRPDS